ncbi:hypothetical protein [Endozoicomonas sp. ALC066]|uniref:hypothetical protein n=1 Tax=Endozoicomonas sp. ALC066 TaxID=3403078 RepID=UPI003BB69AA2
MLWLRETSPGKVNKLPHIPGSKPDFIGRLGHTASILNLGATMAFGFKTLEKLDQIDEKLDIISLKLDELIQRVKLLQWTVDLGFANILKALEVNKKYHEFQISGDLIGAGNIAWSCQFLEPGCAQRLIRIENAYHTVTIAKEKILLHAEEEINNCIEWIEKNDVEDHEFIFDDSVIKSLYRLQQAIVACSLQASISSEVNGLLPAGTNLKSDYSYLNKLFLKVVNSFFNKGANIYRILLSEGCMNFMSAERLGVYAGQFNLSEGSLSDIIELLRMEGFPDKLPSEENTSNSKGFFTSMVEMTQEFKTNERSDKTYSLTQFFNLIDGITNDLDKLNGHSEEYKAASDLKLSVHEYRDLLCLDDIGAVSNNLAFISIDTSKT